MKTESWRDLVSREEFLQMDEDMKAFLDELEQRLNLPGRCPTHDCKDLLAEWVIIGLRAGHVTADIYNQLRDLLRLHQELPEIHLN